MHIDDLVIEYTIGGVDLYVEVNIYVEYNPAVGVDYSGRPSLEIEDIEVTICGIPVATDCNDNPFTIPESEYPDLGLKVLEVYEQDIERRIAESLYDS